MKTHVHFESHGPCSIALITLKQHPKRVYHYSKTSGEEESWALRDYISQQILRSGDSGRTASDVENLIDRCDVEPAYRSVKLVARWKADCESASKRIYAFAYDLSAPNPSTLGNWRRMNKQGS